MRKYNLIFLNIDVDFRDTMWEFLKLNNWSLLPQDLLSCVFEHRSWIGIKEIQKNWTLK